MSHLRLKGGEQQQLLPGQGPDGAVPVPDAEGDVQRAVPLSDLQPLDVAAQQGGDVAAAPAWHDLTHRLSAGEQAVQEAVQKALDAPLSPSGGHGFQKPLQTLLGRAVPALYRHPAAQAHQLGHCRIHHRHRLADGPVHRQVSPAQRHIAIHGPKGMPSSLSELDLGGGLWLLSVPKWSHGLLPFRPYHAFRWITSGPAPGWRQGKFLHSRKWW